MSPEPAPLSYRDLMAELGALCAAKRTGTMFIATTDNHAARIGLRQGDIVSLVFRAQRGLEALDHIRKITAGSFRFSDAVLDKAAHADLPYTADLLALMIGEESPLPPPAPAPPRAAASRAPAPAATPPVGHPQLVRAQAVIE
jgi:hypothetical protein